MQTPVTILLCTYNGSEFLSAQLESLCRQTYGNWRLIASDDGSTDDTAELLADFGRKVQNEVTIVVRSLRLGAIGHFMALLTDATHGGEYFACADQDDVWFPQKIERAMAWMTRTPATMPAVYFSRTQYIDKAGNVIGLSPLFRRHPSFRNALVQSIGGGNTMLFNRAAHQLLQAAGAVRVASHDWWTYLLVSGAGGIIYYDATPTLAYRQHGNNQIGANQGIKARLKRINMIRAGQLKTWLDWHASALLRHDHLLTQANREVLYRFVDMRSDRLKERLRGWFAVRPYRQTVLSQLALFATCLSGRL